MMHATARQITEELGVDLPLKQARRCIRVWLKENRCRLPRADRVRLEGLMARYFYYEDDTTDQLLLSFLRHYSGRKEVDMDDPTSVRMEIKDILDRAMARPALFHPVTIGALFSLIFAIAGFFVWNMSQLTLTDAQQESLKQKVEQVAAADGTVSRAAVWSKVKKPLNASQYKDISYWDYDEAATMLDEWLKRLSAGM